jgi:3',5'-cyclic AMP phosphodiesterase CpdA
LSRRLLAALLSGAVLLTTAFLVRRPGTPSFFFIQMSDPQFGMYAADSNFAQETTNFEMAIATANRLHPTFVVVTGDLINRPGDSAQAAEYWRIAKKLDTSIPLYNVAGNHDVGNTPTSASVAAYAKLFGPDHYVFRHGKFTAIVLNSTIIDSSEQVPTEFAAQESWLEAELARARRNGASQIVVFQHHPYFLKNAAEPDQYFNIPLAHRARYLGLFHKYGVTAVFAGHYHQNAEAGDGAMEMITTGPVGKPFGGAQSGFRIVTVTDSGISHRYYGLGDLPNRVVVR